MTGFARVDGAVGGWTWTVEARSVNGRGLETRFRGPGGFDGLERAARDAAQARFQRGQLNVTLQARRAGELGSVQVNTDQLERYLDLCRPYVELGRAAAPALDGLLGLPGVIESGAEADDPDALAATEADRFAKRIGELVESAADLNERIVQEAAIMAGRADVREELDRLTSHVQAARVLISADGAVGRRLDFLTQEFMREANTLCSKSATTALTGIGLELKASIDQLREQVQNVE